MKPLLSTCVFALAVSVTAIQAHHSISGVYDTSREVTIRGVVAQFHFVNPHPFLTVNVAERGTTRQWRLELDNRSELVDAGMTAETLKAGDRVAVTGSPGRSEMQSMYVRRLDRPADGFRYEQVGSSPRIRKSRTVSNSESQF